MNYFILQGKTNIFCWYIWVNKCFIKSSKNCTLYSSSHICQSSQYIAGKGIITKPPKNETSVRSITVPSSVIMLLKQYKAIQNKNRLKVGDKWLETDRLFTTWDGNPMHPTTVSSWYPEFLRKYDLPKIRFHDLRHTAATLLITQNVHMKTISSRLGHSNI